MPDTDRRYTVAEVHEFPSDGNRYELVHGELLVTPAPRVLHQRVVGRLYVMLYQYAENPPGIGEVFLSPADVTWGSEDDLVQPDIFVAAANEISTEWITLRTMLLAVEVLSPSSSHHDRVTKRRLYQDRSVATYWVVDADARLVEVWRPTDERPEIATSTVSWRVHEGAEELVIELDSLFADRPV
jgi:Uma2 family endonuclease